MGELLVDDGHLQAEYVASAPGSIVSKRFHPDSRAWWVVVDGQMRVEIEGQSSFVASKGSLVQVPKQTIYSMETIGDRPSLRFAVNVAGAKTLYPRDVQPPSIAGINWVPVRLTRTPAPYDNGNQPHVNLYEAAGCSFETRRSRQTSSTGTKKICRRCFRPIGAIFTRTARSSGS